MNCTKGRGFAVVASEVRTLAQRSANAAKEIKDLTDDSVGRVAEGSALVEEATAAARSMEEQAEELINTVVLFKIDNAVADTAPRRLNGVATTTINRATKLPSKTPVRVAHQSTKRVAIAGGDNHWQEF